MGNLPPELALSTLGSADRRGWRPPSQSHTAKCRGDDRNSASRRRRFTIFGSAAPEKRATSGVVGISEPLGGRAVFGRTTHRLPEPRAISGVLDVIIGGRHARAVDHGRG